MSPIEQDNKRKVQTWLARDTGSAPLRPMWPAVQARLHDRARPVWTWPLTVGSGAFATAGVALGIWIGTLLSPAPSASEPDLWANLGSTLTQESTIVYDADESQGELEGSHE